MTQTSPSWRRCLGADLGHQAPHGRQPLMHQHERHHDHRPWRSRNARGESSAPIGRAGRGENDSVQEDGGAEDMDGQREQSSAAPNST